jgi:hypothetical protein
MNSPSLIDNSTKFHILNSLSQCHEKRVNIYYYVLNLGILACFLLVVGMSLYYCNKNKLTPYEKQQKLVRDQEYILSKIRFHQQQNIEKNNQMSSITNLPFTNT